jgi:hypothetical protein
MRIFHQPCLHCIVLGVVVVVECCWSRRRKISKANGALNPTALSTDNKTTVSLTGIQSLYRDAWLGKENAYTTMYADLKDLCARAAELQLTWSQDIPHQDLPSSWVSGWKQHAHTTHNARHTDSTPST